MALKILAASVALLFGASATELTKDTWDSAVAGKTVFIKFHAPWCVHCQKIKPAWDLLMDDFALSPTSLVADFDCTTDSGKDFCKRQGVNGHPHLMYGDPSLLRDYRGGGSYEELSKFADEKLGPSCGPDSLDLCRDDVKEMYVKYLKMSVGKIEGRIRSAAKALEEDVPVMKQVWDSMQKDKEDKEEL